MSPETPNRWAQVHAGPDAAAEYRRRFTDLAAAGQDLDGEARFVAALLAPPAHILDAGCGFGRVVSALDSMGYSGVGVDADPDLLALAEPSERVRFEVADLATLALDDGPFDAAILAGNVVPYLADDTLDAAIANVAAHLREDGLLVAGFSLAGSLPENAGDVSVARYDAAARDAGLTLVDRYASWDGLSWNDTRTYAVSVHAKL